MGGRPKQAHASSITFSKFSCALRHKISASNSKKKVQWRRMGPKHTHAGISKNKWPQRVHMKTTFSKVDDWRHAFWYIFLWKSTKSRGGGKQCDICLVLAGSFYFCCFAVRSEWDWNLRGGAEKKQATKVAKFLDRALDSQKKPNATIRCTEGCHSFSATSTWKLWCDMPQQGNSTVRIKTVTFQSVMMGTKGGWYQAD